MNAASASRRATALRARAWLLLAAGLLGGCGGVAAPTPGDAARPALSGTPAQQAQMQQLHARALRAGEREVVVYQAAMDVEWQPLWAEFAATFPGLQVVYMHLSPAAVTERLDIEAATGARYADVVSQPVNVAFSIAERGYLQPWLPATAQALPARYRGAGDRVLFGFSKVYGLGYNTRRIVPADLPGDVSELLQARWQDRFEYGPPGGGAGTTDVALVNLIARGRLRWADLPRLRDRGRVGGVQEGSVISLAQGRAALSPWVYLPPFRRQQQAGARIGMTFPADFSLLVPFGQGLVREPAHPNAARLLLAWLLSPRGQAALAEKSSTLGNMPGAPTPAGFPDDPQLRAAIEPLTPEQTARYLARLVPVARAVWQGGDTVPPPGTAPEAPSPLPTLPDGLPSQETATAAALPSPVATIAP
ncbi:ABC transporter substrate-binding protein [Pseudoxanthomonas winnipegensis]|uniref:ABC transporter substrate-binding protein n=1 Tax=Pseudoxanthomonas winnipegensis TaxID=2480810 RepID=A0A4Q8LTT0_9GAMM|nr:ABC transporter substrate-binding protein [Pseudoxanthomonas winnipegensis]RZZ83036.1 hypothetical protein EA663_17830 [Pseudoxanthomonas winnipegensis]TAA35377.1 hypothetical protein EA656_06660 [Pseudoxanthomonas winnipegensis]